MKELIDHAGPIVAVGTVVVNFLWSSLNLRLMRSMERKFVTREVFHAEQRVQNTRHEGVIQRLQLLEGQR